MTNIKLAFSRGRREGVENLLSEMFHGKVRVTKRRDILTKISSYVSPTVTDVCGASFILFCIILYSFINLTVNMKLN